MSSANNWWANTIPHAAAPPASKPALILPAISLTIMIVSAMLWSLIGLDMSKPQQGQYDSTEYPASIEAVLTGCGSYFAFEPTTQQYGVYDVPEVTDQLGTAPFIDVPIHRMIVPAYGYMTGDGDLVTPTNTKPEGDTPEYTYMYTAATTPTRSEVLRAMYNGTHIIWYSPTTNQTQRDTLQEALKTINNQPNNPNPTIAIEWTEERNIPLARNYAYATWNITQSCLHFDPEIYAEFQNFTKAHPQYRPPQPNPPHAQVKDGELLPITPTENK